MSYGFLLLRLEPETDLHEALSAQDRATSPHLFSKESKQHSQAIANALKLKNPKLDWHLFATSNIEGIEIDAATSGDGIQIHLFPDEAGITVPFWHKAEYAREVFLQIWDYLSIVQQMTDYVIFDRQLDKIIDLEADFDRVLSTYLGTMDKIVNVAHSRLGNYDTDHASLLLFHDSSITLDDAARILKDDALTVEYKGDALRVQWRDGPILTIRLTRGKVVQQMATEIGKDTPYAEELTKCDTCFRIGFEDLEEVLDEINTLIETTLTLQSATRSFLFNTWNNQLSPLDEE